MPAKKKIAKKAAAQPVKKSAKAPAKPVKKAAIPNKAKPAVKAKSSKPAKPAAKKPAPKPAKKPVSQPAPKAAKPQIKSPAKKPAAKATKPAVKSSKPAAQPAKVSKPAAKKPAPKSPPPVKKSPPVTNKKASAPAKAAKPAAEAKTTKPAPAAKAPEKKTATPAPEPVAAAPAKKEAVEAKKPAPAPAKSSSSKSSSKSTSVASPGKDFKAGPPIKSVSRAKQEEVGATIEVQKNVKVTPLMKKQKARLIELRSMLLDSMDSVAEGSLRARPEGSEASAFGMHQADAGSDAYDRDFALSLLSQEQDSLYEINEALKRLEMGTYGICEMSGKPIPEIRLEALPFTRYTVECQAQLERDNMGGRYRRPVRSLFGLEDSADGDDDSGDDEESETVDKKEE